MDKDINNCYVCKKFQYPLLQKKCIYCLAIFSLDWNCANLPHWICEDCKFITCLSCNKLEIRNIDWILPENIYAKIPIQKQHSQYCKDCLVFLLQNYEQQT